MTILTRALTKDEVESKLTCGSSGERITLGILTDDVEGHGLYLDIELVSLDAARAFAAFVQNTFVPLIDFAERRNVDRAAQDAGRVV